MQKTVMTLDLAVRVARAAEDRARAEGWTVCIAVVDDGAHLVHFSRIDGTQTGSIAVAIEKARTAISFRRPTKIFEDQVNGGSPNRMGMPNVLPVDGGLPIIVNGEYIGAVGVSGVAPWQDAEAAAAGAAAAG